MWWLLVTLLTVEARLDYPQVYADNSTGQTLILSAPTNIFLQVNNGTQTIDLVENLRVNNASIDSLNVTIQSMVCVVLFPNAAQ